MVPPEDDRGMQDAIRTDREKYPNCGYSISSSQSCTNRDGNFVCETIKNVFRVCPGQHPEAVFTNRSQYDGTAVPKNSFPDDGIFLPFKDVSDIFGKEFGDIFDFGDALNRNPDVRIPIDPNIAKDRQGSSRGTIRFGVGEWLDSESETSSDKSSGILGRFRMWNNSPKENQVQSRPSEQDRQKKQPPPRSGRVSGDPEDV